MSDPELTSEQRTQRLVYAATVLLTAIGLAASVALLVDYLRPMPLFCSDTGGCGELRRSAYSHIAGGLPTPALGVGGFIALAVLTLIPGNVARFLHLMAAMFGALAGGLFLFLQFKMATFCAYCMTVDVSSVVLLSLALMRVRSEADSPGKTATAIAGGMFAVALGVPLATNFFVHTTVPDVIAEEMKKTPAGEVTIVDFVDFECPYCRQTAADLEPALAMHAGKYRLVRKQMPLTRIHPHAAAAARAACCGEIFHKGDEMALRLFSAPLDELDDPGCTKIAASLGINETVFRACLSDPKTQQRIESDQADFKAARGHALPTIWINDQLIEGAQGPDKLREAMDKAVAEAGG